MEKKTLLFKDYKLYLTVLVITIICERIGSVKIPAGPGTITLLPMIYAMILCLALYLFKPAKFLKEKQSNTASSLISIGITLLIAKISITSGVGNGLFGSNDPCTRGQIVSFLWRAAGSPAPKGTAVVPADVLPGSYCYDAVAWALENGITNGLADGTFGVNNTCTRGQSVTFLYRAMGTAPTTVNGFTDVAAGDFYAEAVAWAVENGVTNGTSASTFSPNAGCTRAQIVTFLFRTYQGK